MTQRLLKCKIDKLYDMRAINMRYVWLLIISCNIFYMITDPVYDSPRQITVSALYIFFISVSLISMIWSVLKDDLSFTKISYISLALNNLVGTMRLVSEERDESEQL